MRGALTTLGIAAGLSALVGVGNALGACGSSASCCGVCDGSEAAAIDLSCAPADLTSVSVTGPCTSSFDGEGPYTEKAVYVDGQASGNCHVVLTFATGFTYATDVGFTSQTSWVCGSQSCGSCGEITRPTGGPYMVENPFSTCVLLDAGSTE